MGAFAITRWLVAGVHSLPALERALDRWAQRRAMQRRERRARLAAQRTVKEQRA
jgi:hypothetical protein